MKIGTRSILFGAHCWFIHPWFVAAAWSKLYGFPTDPRLWVAFFVHDLGYWGKPNIDGDEGESHPILGARIMGELFDERVRLCEGCFLHRREVMKFKRAVAGRRSHWIFNPNPITGKIFYVYSDSPRGDWHDFALCHSRYYADKIGKPTSKLYAADKLAMILEPVWLYLPRVILSGEYREFKERATSKYGVAPELVDTPLKWHRITVAMMKRRAAGAE